MQSATKSTRPLLSLAGAWDQNAGLRVMSPVGAAVEDISLSWLVDIFGLPCGRWAAAAWRR